MEAQGSGKARAWLFRLCSGVVADGLGPESKRAFAGFTELAPLVDPDRGSDDEAADHQELFGFRVPPYAGVFLDEDGRLGGRAADASLEAYAAGGLAVVRADIGPDHLATQLDFLAHCAEHDLRDAARAFLDGHVLSWLPSLAAAVDREPFPSYRGLMEVVLEAVVEYRGVLGPPAPPMAREPDGNDVLSDPKTGVREIAGFLATPARSGIWLGRGDVQRLGRAADAPRGFGGRVLMLGNLLRSAAEFGVLEAVLAGIDRIAADTASRWIDAPGPWTGHWTSLIERTRGMLAEMEGRIREAPDQN